jgi:imidazoleglycerol-phosphate dehydratase / histidinol-phosphatase
MKAVSMRGANLRNFAGICVSYSYTQPLISLTFHQLFVIFAWLMHIHFATFHRMKRALFIDRDGTIILEPPDEQIDSLEKLVFVPRAISTLARIARDFDYELVLASNQDGLGTPAFPEATFYPAHNAMLTTLRGEGVVFANELIDRSFPHENLPTRKPDVGMFGAYMTGEYDLAHSFVIGDRPTDVELAHNLGAQAILLRSIGSVQHPVSQNNSTFPITLETPDWRDVYDFLAEEYTGRLFDDRTVTVRRTTNETDIEITLNLDGSGKADNHTGLGFFDHLLDQLARHSACDLSVHAKGDLHIDEHHTIEDTALALGEAFVRALGDKRGIERYGYFLLPMDEALAEVALRWETTQTHAAIDFSGRNWLVWDAKFFREKIGDVPTEMFHHFFKSFTDTAKCTLNIRSHAENEHHNIEAIFKAFAKALKMAVKRDARNTAIPSTKGVL